MTNILITGVNGFLGMHLATHLLKKNFNVIGLDKSNSNIAPLSTFDNFSFYKADITNASGLPKEIKNCKEGDTLTLNVHRMELLVRCKQIRDENPYSEIPFEEMVRSGFEKIRKQADWLTDEGEKSLLEAGVIISSNDPHVRKHGPNGYPFEETQPE